MNKKWVRIHDRFKVGLAAKKHLVGERKGFLLTTALGGITIGVILIGVLALGVNTAFPGVIQNKMESAGSKLMTSFGTTAGAGESEGSSGVEPSSPVEEVKLLADVIQLAQCEGGAGVKAPSGLDLKIRKYYYASRTASLSDYTRYEETTMRECAPYNCFGITGLNYTGWYDSGGYAITVVYDASGKYQGEVPFHTNICKYSFVV